MHIAFLTPEFPHKELNHSAGLGTSIYNTALGLVTAGVKVSVIAYSQDNDKVIEFNGIKIYAIKHVKYSFLGWYFYRKRIQKFVNKLIDSEGIDLIEAPDWTGITSFIKFKVPLVIRIHGSDTYFCNLEKRPVKKKNFFFEKRALKRANQLVSVSKFAGKKTVELFQLNKTFDVIPNGIDLKNFENDSPHLFKRNTILYFGTLIRKKGVFELAKIFNIIVEKIPSAELMMIGGDAFDIKTGKSSTFELMRELFSDKAIKQVKYLGKVPYEEMKRHIQNAHVCVFPSLAESFGMVTIEAMALNKLVVSSNYGWAQEIIDEDVNGFLEDPKMTETFANKICEVMNDEGLLKRVSENSRKKIEQEFNINHLSERNIKFYKNVIDGANTEVN
jgi:glycosyltransferase involved in cell wall biosynthesis